MKGDIKFFREAVLISIAAIVIGTILEVIFRTFNKKLKKLFKGKPINGQILSIVSSSIQIFINIVLLYIFYFHTSSFRDMLEKSNPGMIFPAILFGMQQNIYVPFLNVIDKYQTPETD
jgi:hypothetical protein